MWRAVDRHSGESRNSSRVVSAARCAAGSASCRHAASTAACAASIAVVDSLQNPAAVAPVSATRSARGETDGHHVCTAACPMLAHGVFLCSHLTNCSDAVPSLAELLGRRYRDTHWRPASAPCVMTST